MKIPKSGTHDVHLVIHIRQFVAIDVTGGFESFQTGVNMLGNDSKTRNQVGCLGTGLVNHRVVAMRRFKADS